MAGGSYSGLLNQDDVEDDPTQESSSKWSLTFLRKYLNKKLLQNNKSSNFVDPFEQCNDVIIKTLMSAESSIVSDLDKLGNRQKCCFEVYGFDIIFDDEFRPWVLEVNCLPSLSSSSMFDKQVKT